MNFPLAPFRKLHINEQKKKQKKPSKLIAISVNKKTIKQYNSLLNTKQDIVIKQHPALLKYFELFNYIAFKLYAQFHFHFKCVVDWSICES
jgi:hypothetical protein